MLRDCLLTLAAQSATPGLFEVVVVDDGSRCDLRSVVGEVSGSGPAFRYVRQEPGGLNLARNHGATAARGDLLAYLDDDTLVSPGWAEALVAAFERWGCDGVAGRIQLRLEGPEPRWLAGRLRSYLSELDLGPQPLWLTSQFPWGANCAVTRSGFDMVEGFIPGGDRLGSSLVSSGDVDFFRRLRAAGGRIAYWPAAHVLHRVPPERLTPDFFRRRAFAQGISDIRVLQPELMSAPRWRTATREVLRAGRAIPICGRSLLEGRGVLRAMFWLSYCRGRLAALKEQR